MLNQRVVAGISESLARLEPRRAAKAARNPQLTIVVIIFVLPLAFLATRATREQTSSAKTPQY